MPPLPKPEPRKRTKARRDRLEAKVKRAVRAACVERDGYCLMARLGMAGCAGPSEWAHFSGHRRSQTRGLEPGARHDTRWSGILCRLHHRLEERGELVIEYGPDGADGPLTDL